MGTQAKWYFVNCGNAQEIDFNELVKMIKNGQMPPETYVTTDGMGQWIHASQSPEIMQAVVWPAKKAGLPHGAIIAIAAGSGTFALCMGIVFLFVVIPRIFSARIQESQSYPIFVEDFERPEMPEAPEMPKSLEAPETDSGETDPDRVYAYMRAKYGAERIKILEEGVLNGAESDYYLDVFATADTCIDLIILFYAYYGLQDATGYLNGLTEALGDYAWQGITIDVPDSIYEFFDNEAFDMFWAWQQAAYYLSGMLTSEDEFDYNFYSGYSYEYLVEGDNLYSAIIEKWNDLFNMRQEKPNDGNNPAVSSTISIEAPISTFLSVAGVFEAFSLDR